MKKHFIAAVILLAIAGLLGCHKDEPIKSASVEKAEAVNIEKPITEPVITKPPVKKASTSNARAGRVTYELHCAGCHAAGLGHAATMKLKLARAEGMSVLVQRTDLTSAYISYIVRDGLLEMPPFRPTDINDEELENLAQYMIEQGKAYQQQEANNE
jgi:mono/diheme cytochrome c family protein